MSGSLSPLADRRPAYTMRPGCARNRCAFTDLVKRGEDVCCAVGLSRQNIARKNALTRLAGITAAKPDLDSYVSFYGLQTSPYPAIG